MERRTTKLQAFIPFLVTYPTTNCSFTPAIPIIGFCAKPVCSSRFPPATQYIAGWPQQLLGLEANIANINAKAYLYGLVHNMTLNVCAFSSLIGETFFSELTLNDKTGTGTVSANQFGEFIGQSTEQLQIRLDPERSFSYCTSKCKVYDIVDEADDETESDTTVRPSNFKPGSLQKLIQSRYSGAP